VPPQLLFENFIIQIDELNKDSYTVRLIESPWGETQTSVSLSQLEELQKLNNALDVVYMRGDIKATRALIKRLSKMLFDTVVQGDIRRRYDKTLGFAHKEEAIVRILFRVIPQEWADLLLELLCDNDAPHIGDQFLCRSRNTLLARYPRKTTPDNSHRISFNELKILVVISSPTDRPQLGTQVEKSALTYSAKQKAELSMRFLHFSPSVIVKYVECATYASLEAKMRSYCPHVIHFIGHAEQVEGKIGLVLEDDNHHSDIVREERLFRLFRVTGETLQLVSLNACKSFDICQQLVSYYGISMVIGTKFPVHDRVAINFTARLYSSLMQGQPIDYAVREAREGTLSIDDYGWIAYVLTMHNKDGFFFTFTPSPELTHFLEEFWLHISNLTSKVKEVYEAAVDALIKLGAAAVGLLVMAATTVHLALPQREGAVTALGGIMRETDDTLPIEPLTELARNPQEQESIRKKAVEALGESDQLAAQESLLELLTLPDDNLTAEEILAELDQRIRSILTETQTIENEINDWNNRLEPLVAQIASLENESIKVGNEIEKYKQISKTWSNGINRLAELAARRSTPELMADQIDAMRIHSNKLAKQTRDKYQLVDNMLQSFSVHLAQSSNLRSEIHRDRSNIRQKLSQVTLLAKEVGLPRQLDRQLQSILSKITTGESTLQKVSGWDPTDLFKRTQSGLAAREFVEMNNRDDENLSQLDGASIIAADRTFTFKVVGRDSIITEQEN